MNLTQARPRHYWRSNDEADFAFKDAGTEQSEIVQFYDIQCHLNHDEVRCVPITELELLLRHFGAARPTGIDTNIK